MSSSEWESLKFSVRDAVKRLETSLRELNRLNAEFNSSNVRDSQRGPDVSHEETANDLRSDFDRVHRKLTLTLDQMQKSLSGYDPAKSSQITRFREQASQSRKDWDRQWSIWTNSINRQTLIGGGNAPDGSAPDKSAGALLHERGSLLQSMGMIDSAIDTAAAADTMIRRQNESLISITGKVGIVVSKIPFVNSLLSRINSRQIQERIILSLVIGVCISIFAWMRILK